NDARGPSRDDPLRSYWSCPELHVIAEVMSSIRRPVRGAIRATRVRSESDEVTAPPALVPRARWTGWADRVLGRSHGPIDSWRSTMHADAGYQSCMDAMIPAG